VSQAFSLRFAQGLTGVRMGLQPEEVEQIRQWVERKCQQWKLSPGYVYQHLLTAQFADPELVKEARERRSGHKLEAITPLHLSAIAKTLPYNFEMQWVVAEAVKTRMLTVPQTRALAQAVANIQTIDEAIEIIMGRDWKKTAVTRPEPNHEVHLEPRIISEFISDEFTIGLLLIQNALLRGVQLNTSPIDFDDQSPALESFVESLSDLPVLARRINLLHGVFGLPVDDVSRVLNMEISEVANHLGIPPEEQHEGLIEKFAGDASLSDEKVPLPEEHNGSVKTNSYFDDLQTSTVEISPPVPEYAPDRDSHNNGEVPVDLPIEESLAAETVTERSAPYLEPATFNEPDEYEGGMVDIKLAEDETYALLVLLRAPNHRVLLENNGIKYDGTALRKMKRVNDFFLEKKMETGIDLSRYVDETLPRLVQKLREFARGNRRAFMIANQGHAGTLLEFLTNLPSEELESLIGNLYQVYLSAE
ncbi:hypothetical protein HY358_01685, partial [Candidatus Roizmanbacteria bacterium]|nr:hypothetical protein [Candidatus Roizmanbacteria bacterium]